MFSEALYILDRNTTQYMIEELQDELKEKDTALKKKDSALKKKDSALKKKDKELSDAQARIRMLEEQLKQKK